MQITIDTSELPPVVSLAEPEDFKRFKVVVDVPPSMWIERETILQLARERAGDPQWLAGLDAMLAYAAGKGWLNEQGAVQAHVECLS